MTDRDESNTEYCAVIISEISGSDPDHNNAAFSNEKSSAMSGTDDDGQQVTTVPQAENSSSAKENSTTEISSKDPAIEHRPSTWTIDVGESLGDDILPSHPPKILHYAVSGNGAYVATLSATQYTGSVDEIECFNDPVLNIWDLGIPGVSVGSQGSRSQKYCAGRKIRRPGALQTCFLGEEYFTTSVSWDASQISVMEAHDMWNMSTRKCTFGVYRNKPRSSDTTVLAILEPFTGDQLVDSLRDYTGRGKFHIIDTKNLDVKKELFVTCDAESVEIYSVYDKWNHIHSVALEQTQLRFFSKRDASMDLISSLRGRYFAWVGDKNTVSLQDIRNGSLVSIISPTPDDSCEEYARASCCFSDDETMVAIARNGMITTHWIQTGSQLGSFRVPLGQDYQSYIIKFIHSDKELVVAPIAKDERTVQGHILETSTMSISCDFLTSGAYHTFQDWSKAGLRMDDHPPPALCFTRGPILGSIWLTGLIERPSSSDRSRASCCFTCEDNLSELHGHSMEYTSPEGLRFEVKLHGIRRGESTKDSIPTHYVISVSSTQGDILEKLIIPTITPSDNRDESKTWDLCAVFLDSWPRLVVVVRDLVMIWGLPTTLDGDFTLLLAWSIPVTEELGGYRKTCEHQQLCIHVLDPDEGDNMDQPYWFNLRVERPFGLSNESTGFSLCAMGHLTDTYAAAGGSCRNAILRYVGSHLNSYPVPGDLKRSILPYLSSTWTEDFHKNYKLFIATLLKSKYGLWVPRQDISQESNPIWILLEHAKTKPRAMGLVEVYIDYCLRQAKVQRQRDHHFLFPVFQVLHIIVHDHTDLAVSTLRNVAFLQVQNRAFIIDRHIIAAPPRLRWSIWKRDHRRLYNYKDPILQLSSSSEIHDPKNDSFILDLFVATFDMLWSCKDPVQSGLSLDLSAATSATPSLSWLRIMSYMIMHKCKPTSVSVVKCHDFTLEALDNPGIEALVEYKWNTIGFSYWITRFLFQCCFYILVLTAVFGQVYRNPSGPPAGVFVAIIVASCIFLWMEVLQFAKDRRRFFTSVYNIVDLAAFGLPLCGSINQLCVMWGNASSGANPGLLSFSVLFIALHFLFELRVNYAVCHFVTIIIQVISSIRVFFLISTGTILAFATAILHLLHSCPGESCPNATDTEFPMHFYKAAVATFYFIGGRYDPIANQFDTDNWAFLTMMILNFVFTGILMINVLIALINVAFNQGDLTWRLVWIRNRMRYVEAAENMTYHIPGFRKKYNWFPREIYYSATPKRIKEYVRATKKRLSEASYGQSDAAHTPGITDERVFASKTLPSKAAEMTEPPELLQPQDQRRSHGEQIALPQQQFESKIVALENQISVLQQTLKTRDDTMQKQLDTLLSLLADKT